jgi:hypothetical protein
LRFLALGLCAYPTHNISIFPLEGHPAAMLIGRLTMNFSFGFAIEKA